MGETWAMALYKSPAWAKLRVALIAERGHHCSKCGRVVASSKALIADHVIELTPENVQDKTVALNPENVQLLCMDCHNAKHKRFGHACQRVVLVYGPPCSGKSTWVAQQMVRGDLVVDMDFLYHAVSGCCMYDKPDALSMVVYRIRDNVLDSIKTRLGKWQTAYVVGGYPFKAKREALAKELGAELMFIDTPMDQCMVNADASRGIHAADWKRYIQKWFDDFEK